ncbi:hypothetical protein D3C83_137490 [compost metagenome]
MTVRLNPRRVCRVGGLTGGDRQQIHHAGERSGQEHEKDAGSDVDDEHPGQARVVRLGK